MNGNTGFRVKNLRHTKFCKHKTSGEVWHDQVDTAATKCIVNGCNTELTTTQKRGCHVISANQNTNTGTRFIVVMCDHHNKLYDIPLVLRANAKRTILASCFCGHTEKTFDSCAQCKEQKKSSKKKGKKSSAKRKSRKKGT